jgi:hypothetical protein
MLPHRLSYLKAVLAALGVCVGSLALAIYWLAMGQVGVPWTGWFLPESQLLLWALTAGLIALGLVCLLVATGGLFALHGDAREGGRIRAESEAPR